MLTREQTNKKYLEILHQAREDGNEVAVMRKLCTADLFFLLTRVLLTRNIPEHKSIDRDWLYDRCREVQAEPDGYLDLWAREHYKSTIITYGLTMMDILRDPNTTVGIFSVTYGLAVKQLKPIKMEFETNELLRSLFADIIWDNPSGQASTWREDAIVLKRTSNAREMTVQAHGMVDGMPTGSHFDIVVIDDAVTQKSVTTEEQIKKTLEAWELSLHLGSVGGRRRYIGTRYHYSDLWGTIIDRKAAEPRLYAATDDGTISGKPVLIPEEDWQFKLRSSSAFDIATQMLLDPKALDKMGFDETWLRFWKPKVDKSMNIYLLIDPANTKNKRSDYTAMFVVGYSEDGNFYVIDIIRDKFNLHERTMKIIELDRKYRPMKIGYERYGMNNDIEAMEMVMELENYRFSRKIVELRGNTAKNDRIKKLIVPFKQNRIYLPYECKHKTWEGDVVDNSKIFVNTEYLGFPYSDHDDMLDCLSRIMDDKMKMRPPAKGMYNQKKTVTKSVTEYDVFGA